MSEYKSPGVCRRCKKTKKLNGNTGLCLTGCNQFFWSFNKDRKGKNLEVFSVDEFNADRKTLNEKRDLREKAKQDKIRARFEKIIYFGLCRRCATYPVRVKKNGLCHSCQTIYLQSGNNLDEFLLRYLKARYSVTSMPQDKIVEDEPREKEQTMGAFDQQKPLEEEPNAQNDAGEFLVSGERKPEQEIKEFIKPKCLKCGHNPPMGSGLCAECQKKLGEVNSFRKSNDKPLLTVDEFAKVIEVKPLVPPKVVPLQLVQAKKEEHSDSERLFNEIFGIEIKLAQNWEDLGVIFQSQAMAKVLSLVEEVAPLDVTVLITGDTGVGKGMIARMIHHLSKRKDEEFITAHCPSVARELFEAELFGHVKGAFTGALEKGRLGLFKQASNGTIFLDEITEVEVDLQAKLLQVVEEKEVRAVGSDKTEKVNVRIIAASNQNLEDMVKANKLRRDLYHRLSVVQIHIPPLADRIEDIACLTEFFVEKFLKKHGKQIKWNIPDLVSTLMEMPLLGNVRELSNIIEGETIRKFSKLKEESVSDLSQANGSESSVSSYTFQMRQAKKKIILNALKEGGNGIKAAAILGTSRSALYRNISELGIDFKKG